MSSRSPSAVLRRGDSTLPQLPHASSACRCALCHDAQQLRMFSGRWYFQGMQGPQKGGLSRIPTSDQGQEVLPGGGHQPPLPARDLRAQRAVAPVHVARQQAEVPGERAPRLHQLVRVRQPSCVDSLQTVAMTWSDLLSWTAPTCMHACARPAWTQASLVGILPFAQLLYSNAPLLLAWIAEHCPRSRDMQVAQPPSSA